MPPGRTAGTEYVYSEEELMALEQELAAQEAVPSPGLGAGSAAYSEPVPPPPTQTAPSGGYATEPAGGNDVYYAVEPTGQTFNAASGQHSGQAVLTPYDTRQPPRTEPAYVPPPPSAGSPSLDFLNPLGAARDAAIASPVGQAVGNVLGAPLPFADQLPPPPTEVGQRLAAGDPGGAAQLVGDVATADPLTTASLLIGGPLLGTVGRAARLGRAALGLSRARRGGSILERIEAENAKSVADHVARSAAIQRIITRPPDAFDAFADSWLGPAALLAGTVGPLALIEKAKEDERYRAARAGASTTTPAGRSSPTAPATSAPTTTTHTSATTTGGAATPQTTSAPGSTPARATPTTPANATASSRAPAASAPAVSAPGRSSSPPPSVSTDATRLLNSLGLVDAVEFDSAAPFSSSDFLGRLGDLPELKNVGPNLARRMANTANAKLRKKRGRRGFPFSLTNRQFGDLIRASVMESLGRNNRG